MLDWNLKMIWGEYLACILKEENTGRVVYYSFENIFIKFDAVSVFL